MFLNNRRLGVVLVVVGLLTPAIAGAQNLAVTGGAIVNPDQFYVGAKYDWPLIDNVWLEPSMDLGFGNDMKLVAGNLDATYRKPLSRRSPWIFVGGGGPALNHYRFPGSSDTQLGLNLLAGLRHSRGLFMEMRVGVADSPDFRFGVGYTIRPARHSAPRR